MALSLLLVEDNARTREQILEMLANSGFQVTVAVDGLDGLNRARKECFDLVLLDHKMPLMDGFMLLKNLREEPEYDSTPLVFMTTSEPNQVADKAARFGATLVLGKPLQADVLISNLRDLTKRRVVA